MPQRPPIISSNNYVIALKPLLGREKKLKISTQAPLEVAGLSLPSAAAITPDVSVAGNLALADSPRELVIKLEEALQADGPVLIGVMGTDQNGIVLSGMARFSPPAYAQEQNHVHPAGTCREVVVPTGKKFKTITTYVPMGVPASAAGGKFGVFGMPDLSTYVLVGCRVNLNYTPESRVPAPIPCGGDDSAFVKPGQKPQRQCSITVKEPSLSDGLTRYNGVPNICALLVSDKEDKLVTDHEFLIGLTLTGKHDAPEASEAATLSAEGIYEDYAHIPAGPLTGE